MWLGVPKGSLAVNLVQGAPLSAALGIAAGNTVEVLLALHLLRRARFEPSLARTRDVGVLVAAALPSASISATIATLTLVAASATSSSAAFLMWVSWLVGDFLSILVVTPLVLLLMVGRDTTRRAGELESALAFVTVLAGSVVFVGGALPRELRPILERVYLIYPVLLWPSMRIGPRGSAIAITIVSVVAIVATKMNRGTFGATGGSVTALIALQVFLGVVALTQLLLASAVAESRLRDKLMSIAAHELRGPLGTLAMALDMVREAPSERGLDSAQRQISRLAALVQELLETTRLGAPRLRLSAEPIDLAELAAGVLSRLEPTLRGAKCDVTLRAEPSMGSWDALRLEQLITNLVTNAARHAQGAPITVSIDEIEDRVRLRVADRGPGIALRDQARIFDAYRSLEREGPGLGLGLHIAREIVVAHGGTLRVESEPGHGAAFVAELPCHPPAERTWMRQRARTDRRAPHERPPRLPAPT
jgi:signal transduction histidine kinase